MFFLLILGEEISRTRKGKIQRNRDGTQMRVDEQPHEKGFIFPEFIEKHNLSTATTPLEYREISYHFDQTS